MIFIIKIIYNKQIKISARKMYKRNFVLSAKKMKARTDARQYKCKQQNQASVPFHFFSKAKVDRNCVFVKYNF